LDDTQRHEFEHLLLNEPDPGVRTMAITLFDRICQEGLLQGQRQFLLMQLNERFGPLRPQVYEIVHTLPEERLAALGRALFQAHSLRELDLEGEDRDA
jgi:hypothetical protein